MNEASKMIANLAIIQSSNKQEATLLLAEAMAHILYAPSPTTSPLQTVFKEEPRPEAKPIETKEVKKKVQRTVLTRKGVICSCDKCGQDIYEIANDVYDNMKTEEFVKCFKPRPGFKELNIPLNVSAIDDAVLTDCPSCSGELSLLLWGKRPKLSEKSSDVGTLDQETIKSLGG